MCGAGVASSELQHLSSLDCHPSSLVRRNQHFLSPGHATEPIGLHLPEYAEGKRLLRPQHVRRLSFLSPEYAQGLRFIFARINTQTGILGLLPLRVGLVELVHCLPQSPLGVLVDELELVLAVNEELFQLPVVDLVLYRLFLEDVQQYAALRGAALGWDGWMHGTTSAVRGSVVSVVVPGGGEGV